MSTFQDAIAQAISDEDCMMQGATPDMDLPVFNAGDAQRAWAVLAMPEMQAIRKALRHACWNAAVHAYPHGNQSMILEAYMRKNVALPESVIAWADDDTHEVQL